MAKVGRPVGFRCSDVTRAKIGAANKSRSKIERKPKPKTLRKCLDRNAILDAWVSGEPVWQIAADHSAPKATIRSNLCRARRAGDPRALLRRDQVIQSARREPSPVGARGGEVRASTPASPPATASEDPTKHLGEIQ